MWDLSSGKLIKIIGSDPAKASVFHEMDIKS